MTTKYNPNDGTGRWYVDAPELLEEVEFEEYPLEINWFIVSLIVFTSTVTAIFMTI